MRLIYFLLIVTSESLFFFFIPNDRIITLTDYSLRSMLVINKTDFLPNSTIYIYFKSNKGDMDEDIYYNALDILPSSYDDFPEPNETSYYDFEEDEEFTIYTFEMEPLSNNYYIIDFYGVSLKSISVVCTNNKTRAKYLPKAEIDIPSSANTGYIYLEYNDFPDTDDLYVYFKIRDGDMNSTIKYEETNVDPRLLIAFSSAVEKEGEVRNTSSEKDSAYVYNFLKTDYQYLIIYYSSLYGSSTKISSSTKIKFCHIKAP